MSASSWHLMGWLAVEVALVVVLTLLVTWRMRSVIWQRTLWQAGLIALGGVLVVEFAALFPTPSPKETEAVAPVMEARAEAGEVPPSVTQLPVAATELSIAPGPPLELGPVVTEPVREVVEVRAETAEAGASSSIISSVQTNPESGFPLALAIVLGVWVVGSLVLTLRLLVGRILLLRFCARSQSVFDVGLFDRVQGIAGKLGLKQGVQVLETERIQTPVVFGLFRVTIALPVGFAERFERRQQEAILAHELAHLAARDPLWYLLADALVSVLWWHPLVWVARARLQVTSEMAADEACVLAKHGPETLAECLVTIAQEMHGQGALESIGIEGSGFRSRLGQRVERLLKLSAEVVSRPAAWRTRLVKVGMPVVLVGVLLVGAGWVRRDQSAPWSGLMSGAWNMMAGVLRVEEVDIKRDPRPILMAAANANTAVIHDPAPIPVPVSAKLSGKVKVQGQLPREAEVQIPENMKKHLITPITTRFYKVSSDWGLAYSVVYVKHGLEGKTIEAATEPVTIVAKGLQFQPYIAAAQTGQRIRFQMDDPVLHNLSFAPKNPKNKGWNKAMLPNTPVFETSIAHQERMARISSDTMPWAYVYLNVFEHPYFAVTDAAGRFEFAKPLPPGRYTLAVYHRQAGEAEMEVEVKGEGKPVEFMLEVGGAGKQTLKLKAETEKKLDELVLPELFMDGLPLEVALQFLMKESQRLDPEKKGLQIEWRGIVPAQNNGKGGVLRDPLGAPLQPLRGGEPGKVQELKEVTVMVNPVKKGLSFREVLKAVCEGAAVPLQYNIQNGVVVVTAKPNVRGTKKAEVEVQPQAETDFGRELRTQLVATEPAVVHVAESLAASAAVEPVMNPVRTNRTDVFLPTMEELKKAFAGTNEVAGLLREGKKFYELRLLDEAFSRFRRVAAKEPENKAAYYYLVLEAKALYDARQYVEADEKIKDALKLDPDIQAAHHYRRLIREARESRGEIFSQGGYLRTSQTAILSQAKKRIEAKLEQMVIKELYFDGVPLAEVLRVLRAESVKLDPEGNGISFIIETAQAYQADENGLDPLGAPVPPAPPAVDLEKMLVKINPPLKNLRMIDALDAITKVATPVGKIGLAFTVGENGVVFWQTVIDPPQLYTRIFKVDLEKMIPVLEKHSGQKLMPVTTNLTVAEHTGSSGGSMGQVPSSNSVARAEQLQGMAKKYLSDQGVDFVSTNEAGGARTQIFINDRTGVLMARATLEDLRVIEGALEKLGATAEEKVWPNSSEASLPTGSYGVSILVQEAKRLIELRRMEEAEVKLREALKREPTNATAYYYMNLIQEARYSDRARQRDAEQRARIAEIEKTWEIPAGTNRLPVPNPYVRTNAAQTMTKARQRKLALLDQMVMKEVFFDGLPLAEVVRILQEESLKQDPEKRGINFIINSNLDDQPSSRRGSLAEPLPVPQPRKAVNLEEMIIKINPPLKNLRMIDVLDAVTKVATPIDGVGLSFMVEDYAVVFRQRVVDPKQMFTRVFRVDKDKFIQGLESQTGQKVMPTNSSAVQSLQFASMARQFFAKCGVDVSTNQTGEASTQIFFNDRTSVLMVRASLADLTIIAEGLEAIGAVVDNTPIPSGISSAGSTVVRFYKFEVPAYVRGLERVTGKKVAEMSAAPLAAQVNGGRGATNQHHVQWHQIELLTREFLLAQGADLSMGNFGLTYPQNPEDAQEVRWNVGGSAMDEVFRRSSQRIVEAGKQDGEVVPLGRATNQVAIKPAAESVTRFIKFEIVPYVRGLEKLTGKKVDELAVADLPKMADPAESQNVTNMHHARWKQIFILSKEFLTSQGADVTSGSIMPLYPKEPEALEARWMVKTSAENLEVIQKGIEKILEAGKDAGAAVTREPRVVTAAGASKPVRATRPIANEVPQVLKQSFKLRHETPTNIVRVIRGAFTSTQSTAIADTPNNMLLVNAPEQDMKRVEEIIRKLDVAANGVTSRGATQPLLVKEETDERITKVFKVDADSSMNGFREMMKTSGFASTNLQELMREFIRKSGVNLSEGNTNGSVVFLNDRTGVLLARARPAEMQIIESAIEVLNIIPPQVEIQANYLVIPEKVAEEMGLKWFANGLPPDMSKPVAAMQLASAGSNSNRFSIQIDAPQVPNHVSILSPEQARELLKRLDNADGVDRLSAPRVTTVNKRQAQISVMEAMTVVVGRTNRVVKGEAGKKDSEEPVFITEQFAMGPMLDVIPNVYPDGKSMRLDWVFSLTEFLGYEKQGKSGELPTPLARRRQVTNQNVIQDGYTLVAGCGMADIKTEAKKGLFRSGREKTEKKMVLILMKVNLLDPAGNYVNRE